jgi:hypothetical protein
MRWLIVAAVIFPLLTRPGWGQPRQGTWINLADDGRLLYHRDERGNRIPDFSDCGYLAGQSGIPLVPARVVVQPGEGDDRARIQAAIDQVSAMAPDANGFRGAVLLAGGEYQVSATLNITTSGVVLRGAGESATQGTRLVATDTSGSAENKTVLIRIQGTGIAAGNGPYYTITTPSVPAGTGSFDIDGISAFAVGDEILVHRPSTEAWIQALGMDQLLNNGIDVDHRWAPGSRDFYWQRTIRRIEGNRIFLDAPIPTAIDATYGGGKVRKYSHPGQIEKCGVEDIRGISTFASPDDESHTWTFIEIGAARNCWVRRVSSQHFAYACVSLAKGAKWTSVLNCTSLAPVSLVTGGRRYAFVMDDAEFCLVRDCLTENDRHQFATGSNTSGPNAFVGGVSSNALSDAGPHHRWASGILWDRVTVLGDDLNIRNRGNLGSGHGWSGANSVIWNSKAEALDVENPPTARNWLVGSEGVITTTNSDAVPPNPDFGTYDSNGSPVFPSSLWGNQHQDASAKTNLQMREYVVGDFDRFVGATNSGDPVAVNTNWAAAVTAAASSAGAALGNFDDARTNRWIPWTHSFSVDPGDTIVSATLSFAVRSTGPGWADDVLRIESTNSAATLASLGRSAADPTNSTVLRYDLKDRLADLADGRLNLAVSADTGVDWSVLELRVAPASGVPTSTVTLVAEADAHVQGGTNSASNYGTNTSMLVKEASADVRRRAYVRWNLASLTNRIVDARVRLNIASSSTNLIENSAALAGNGWTESTLNWNNQPASSSPFYSWHATTNRPTLEINVTREVQEALGSDGLLTLQISSARDVGGLGTAGYTTKESSTSSKRPQLIVTTTASTNTAPVLAIASGQTVQVGAAIDPLGLGVADGEQPPTALTVSALSSNPSLVPNSPANLALAGTAAVRTLTIIPAPGATGTATISVTVSDGALSNTKDFLLTVVPSPSPLADLENWWSQKFGSPQPGEGDSSTKADPDKDGLDNFLEYSLGGNPWKPDYPPKNPLLAREAAGYRFTYGPVTNGVSHQVLASTNLAQGWFSPPGLSAATNTNGSISVFDPFGTASPRQKFYRLKVAVP